MQPILVTKKKDLVDLLNGHKKNGKSVGFVPTMGALHRGHAHLAQVSVAENDLTVVSVFVNPKQFGPTEDLLKYPRTLQEDISLCQQKGVDIVFAPTVTEIYPPSFLTSVTVSGITDVLCGAVRPGHFAGVTTVVTILMNLVQAHKMYLGQKDFQQVQVLRQMADDLAHPTEIVMVPTVREDDGLALSSRNRYMNPQTRSRATSIPRALAKAAQLYLDGERASQVLLSAARTELEHAQLVPQYLELRHAKNLLSECGETIEEDAVLAIAQPIEQDNGKTVIRLIDNVLLGTNSSYIDVLKEFVKKALA